MYTPPVDNKPVNKPTYSPLAVRANQLINLTPDEMLKRKEEFDERLALSANVRTYVEAGRHVQSTASVATDLARSENIVSDSLELVDDMAQMLPNVYGEYYSEYDEIDDDQVELDLALADNDGVFTTETVDRMIVANTIRKDDMASEANSYSRNAVRTYRAMSDVRYLMPQGIGVSLMA